MSIIQFQNVFLFQQTESIMNYILVSIAVLSIMALYVNYKTIKVPVFRATAIVILLFNINLFLLNYVTTKEIGFIPFKALFGPLFLFHIKMFNDIKVSGKLILLHSIPFLVLLTAFFFLSLATKMIESIFWYYLIILAEGISQFLYGLYALLPRHAEHSAKLRDIIAICSITFIIDASFTIMSTISVLRSGEFDPYNLFFVSDVFYCVSGLLGWVYFFSSITMMIRPADVLYPSLQRLREKRQFTESAVIDSPATVSDSYKKGRLKESVLEEYEQKLIQLMQREKVYLDNELTLTQLAKLLRMSNPHLTQVLNIRIGLNFYQYINRLRIDYAVKAIERGIKDSNLETLAAECGFNNRASFNRYFKEITGKAPSEYIKNKPKDM